MGRRRKPTKKGQKKKVSSSKPRGLVFPVRKIEAKMLQRPQISRVSPDAAPMLSGVLQVCILGLGSACDIDTMYTLYIPM